MSLSRTGRRLAVLAAALALAGCASFKGIAPEAKLRTPAVPAAATEPVAGSGPSADGPVTSGLVAMNRAPARMSRIAFVIASTACATAFSSATGRRL